MNENTNKDARVEAKVDASSTETRVGADLELHNNTTSHRNEFSRNEVKNGRDERINTTVQADYTGTSTFEIEADTVIGKFKIKISSSVSSSKETLETINEQSRKDLDQLGTALWTALTKAPEVITNIGNAIKENDRADSEAFSEDQRLRQQADHEFNVQAENNSHELRMLTLRLNREYDEELRRDINSQQN